MNISTKITRKALGSLALMGLLVMASCSDDEPENILVASPSSESFTYNDQGVWDKVYSIEQGSFNVGSCCFAHSASESWGFAVWNGFCPSKSTDLTDYTASGDWVSHQFTAITAGGVAGKGAPYLIAYWDSYTSEMSCSITPVGSSAFYPQSVMVTNSTWAYYAMLNGTAFNKKFDSADWLRLTVHGVLDGVSTGEVVVDLAANGAIVNTWKKVDLTSLGNVDMIYFTMSSSDEGEYGMNTPSYFALDQFTYTR